MDGLFNAETIIHMDDHEDRIQTAIRRIREVRYKGLESYLDGKPVETNDSLILWGNPGAIAILDAMNAIRLADGTCILDSDAWTDCAGPLIVLRLVHILWISVGS